MYTRARTHKHPRGLSKIRRSILVSFWVQSQEVEFRPAVVGRTGKRATNLRRSHMDPTPCNTHPTLSQVLLRITRAVVVNLISGNHQNNTRINPPRRHHYTHQTKKQILPYFPLLERVIADIKVLSPASYLASRPGHGALLLGFKASC